MDKAIEYLKKREWSMGNGQCPDCCGVPESWHGHPCHMTAETIGHESGCSLAETLREMGERPLMKGEFKSDAQFEHYISDGGFYGTRPKTTEGCPRIRAKNEKMQQKFDAAVFAAMSERSNVRAKRIPKAGRAEVLKHSAVARPAFGIPFERMVRHLQREARK